MATQANFAATPRAAGATVSTANASVTNPGGGTVASIFTAGANGSRLDSVKIKGATANGANQVADSVRLFLYDGAAYHYLTEQVVPLNATNVSATVPNVEYLIGLGIPLPNGWSLAATTDIGAVYHLTAFGGDF